MPDVQGFADERHLAIQRVGVKGVRHPLQIRTANGQVQPTVAIWNLYVHLPDTQKGTHMSRFLALLEERSAPLDVNEFAELLQVMLVRLEAHSGHVEATFPYFIKKIAPVSGVSSLLDYEVSLLGTVTQGNVELALRVLVPVTSLCPCSKKISDYGAHNQRSHVTVTAHLANTNLSIEELVRLVEDEASCELFGLLKRPDEKWVTERAYDNPKFVEDLVRDVAGRLKADSRISKFVVEAENFESIHNHSAYALIEG
ncbi:GTP cyclohydrolase I FolE2 [Parvibium lacunae]|uniref:GTP cyclohydrolase FolE2 n=2 Tax=Parvibium lacunae TaxID=1888893 RepID=A0A368L8E2_9BURK|nr:GTP cyclohydrolase I FolE2 [Parvibium lacunae]